MIHASLYASKLFTNAIYFNMMRCLLRISVFQLGISSETIYFIYSKCWWSILFDFWVNTKHRTVKVCLTSFVIKIWISISTGKIWRYMLPKLSCLQNLQIRFLKQHQAFHNYKLMVDECHNSNGIDSLKLASIVPKNLTSNFGYCQNFSLKMLTNIFLANMIK